MSSNINSTPPAPSSTQNSPLPPPKRLKEESLSLLTPRETQQFHSKKLILSKERIKELFPLPSMAINFAKSHSIKKLDLTELPLQDSDLQEIAKLNTLDEIHLNCQNLSQGSLNALTPLKINWLYLEKRAFTSTELKSLSPPPFLFHLTLESLFESDTSWIDSFPSLSSLTINKGDVSPALKEALRRKNVHLELLDQLKSE